ncbi:MAG: hypothetical protein KDA24_24520 [Deltaproteobacteria bacterium]|nr:hypothetical protein [Deltaproteobacteria bacterium]
MRTALVLLVLLLQVPAAHASDPLDYAGQFELIDPEAASARVQEVVELGAQQFPAAIRRFARFKLKRVLAASAWMLFETDAENMTVFSPETPDGWTSDLEGTENRVRDARGGRFRIKRWLERGALASVVCRGDGCADFRFTLTGRTLTMTVTTRSDWLDQQLQYSLQYRRK